MLGAILIVIGLYSVLWGKHKEQVENKVAEDIPLPIKGDQIDANPGSLTDQKSDSNKFSSHVIELPIPEPPIKSNN